ncbi:cytochrome P450 [Serendipita vermifera]|nr:cytochrome P450 [Serendipita vermifera]
MDELVAGLLNSPLKACAVSLGVVSLSYLTAKGIKSVALGNTSNVSYPPGPPRRPFIGALTSFPTTQAYQRFTEWAATYGDVVYAPLPGMSMVILNSHDAAHELLSKRPNSTAGRRLGYLVKELMDLGWSTAFIQPGPHHSNQRKMLRRGIGPQRIGSYDSLIETAVAKLMAELETFQGNPSPTILRSIGVMVSKFTYGEKIWGEMGDNLTNWNMEIMELANEAVFTVWLVDFLHFLRFIPNWVPGLRFKELSRESTILSEKVRYRAYRRGLELYKSGTLGHCILNDLLEEFGDDEDVRDATSVLYGVAADTTTGAIIGFLFHLFLYPEVSQRVFEEIQSVTHGTRLPQIADRPNLPYTEAVFKESIRIRPLLPISERLPHVNSEDEVFRGYFIPKGTMIHQCTYAMFHDSRVWKDPEVFRPERFLGPDASETPNPLTVIFGYGMRVCPGMYLADKVAFHIVATIVSLFNIVPLEGKKIPDPKTVEWDDMAIQQPIGFDCRFMPRSEKTRELLKTVAFYD